MFYFHSQPVLLRVLCGRNSCFFLVQSFYSVNSSDMISRGVTGVPKKLVSPNKIVPPRQRNVLSLPNRLI